MAKHNVIWNSDMDYEFLDDERLNLDIELEGKIVVFAELGLWSGNKFAYKETNATNIKDILYSRGDIEFFCDSYNLKAKEIHHDGINSYTYRVIREGKEKSIHNLFDKIIAGKQVTKADINRYTRSLVKEVNNIYGW